MSLRSAVDRAAIQLFLEELGRQYRGAGRLYLVGGTTLVYEGFRRQTLDIDLVIEVAPENHGNFVQALRQLKDSRQLNIEEASPGDFIPLPPGHESRHVFIGRFGQLDVFHFDLYSTCLSKISRGRRQDFEDVILLLENGRIQWDQLAGHFQRILPEVGGKSLKQDPVEFQANFRALQNMLDAPGGNP